MNNEQSIHTFIEHRNVTVNNVTASKDGKDTYCNVVTQDGQFNCTMKGISAVSVSKFAGKPVDIQAYARIRYFEGRNGRPGGIAIAYDDVKMGLNQAAIEEMIAALRAEVASAPAKQAKTA